MLGGEVEDDAVTWVAEERGARGHRFEDAAAALDAEIASKADRLCDEAHDFLGAMDVEVVHDQVSRCCGRALGEQSGEVGSEILRRAGRADVVEDLSGDHAEGGDQRQRTLADVLEFLAFGVSATHGLGWRCPLQGLHAGHLVDAACLDALGGALRGEPVGLADIVTALGEVAVARGIDSPFHTMGLEIGLAQEAPDGVWRDTLNDLACDRLGGQVRIGPARQCHPLANRHLAGEGDEGADLLGGEGRWRAWARRIAEPLLQRLIGTLAPTSAPALNQ
jgi:hypothetical protein